MADVDLCDEDRELLEELAERDDLRSSKWAKKFLEAATGGEN